MARSLLVSSFACLLVAAAVRAEPPVASYVFPAGGKRGEAIPVKVGGLDLLRACNAEILGPGVSITPRLERTKTLWFEGPLLPLPDSQRVEDYPRDMAGRITIAPDATLGVRYLRLWTSQGAAPHLKFIVGDLPEILEEEIDGDPIPLPVKLPLTINGRIFPRGDVDVWTFEGKKGRPVTLEVHALRLGTPLEARLEVRDAKGMRLTESDLPTVNDDVRLRFTPPADGTYSVAIHDLNLQGSQSHVYRLTMSEGPYVDGVYPLGAKKGTSAHVEVTGQAVGGKRTLASPDQKGPVWLQVDVDGQKSNPVLFDVDELNEVTAGAGVDPSRNAVPVSVPVVCNGRIGAAGQLDRWELKLAKGEALDIELRAARLGSPLDGVLTVLDDKGKEVARADSGPEGDPTLQFTSATDGTFVIQVQDRFRSRGGPDFAYRLRITSAATPDFHLAFKTDGISLLRGGQAKLPIAVERLGGFQDAIALSIEGLPKGVTFAPLEIGPKQNALDVTFKADAEVVIGPVRLKVFGTSKPADKKVGKAVIKSTEPEIRRRASLALPLGTLAIDEVLLGVALPTPFKLKGEYDMRWASRGGWFERKYQVERLGYDGPIEVSLADRQARHLQGVTGPTITVPAGATEFTYPVQLPPWMETGRTSRTCVMGAAKIKDKDGSEHEVSFTSTNQNEQIVAVVEPARVSLNLEKTSVRTEAGSKAVVSFTVGRGLKMVGAAKVEIILPVHFRGIRAEPVTVAADKQQGELTLQFEKGASPWNMPITVRATIVEAGRPIIAEATLELVRGGE